MTNDKHRFVKPLALAENYIREHKKRIESLTKSKIAFMAV